MLCAAPLADSTNTPTAEHAAPLAAQSPLDFLSLLADASLQRLGDNNNKRQKCFPATAPAPLECSEVTVDEVVGLPTPLETSVRTRCPSRRSESGDDDKSSSRSTSPASLAGKGLAAFRCNKCAREYASTDAVRKHARQNHTDWLREQGQGCPSLYCTPIDNGANEAKNPDAATPVVAAVATPTAAVTTPAPAQVVPKTYVTAATTIAPGVTRPAALANLHTPNLVPAQLAASVQAHSAATSQMGQAAAVHAAIANAVAATSNASSRVPTLPSTPLSPSSSTLLMHAAESLGALSKAALAEGVSVERAASDAGSDAAWGYGDDDDSPYPSFLRRESSWPLPHGKKAGGARQKRPRSVRCGQCDGCLRDDCGTCKNCVDKPKFGGIGQRKQGCVRKLCRQPRVATNLPPSELTQ